MPCPWAYFDTSALVKRYVREAGSVRARALLRRHRLVTSTITPVELVSALCRRQAEGDLADVHFRAIRARIGLDRAHWELVELVPTVLDAAEAMVERHGLRTLDAIHLAAATTFRVATGISPAFITADERQREAGEREGFAVDWVA